MERIICYEDTASINALAAGLKVMDKAIKQESVAERGSRYFLYLYRYGIPNYEEYICFDSKKIYTKECSVASDCSLLSLNLLINFFYVKIIYLLHTETKLMVKFHAMVKE